MSIDNIIDISISLGAPPLTRQGFGIPLIVASASNLNAGFTEKVRSYFSAADAQADNDLQDAIKGRIAAIFAQERTPSTVKVGKREADVAQVNTYVIGGTANGTYTISLNGTPYAFSATGSTLAEIRDGLIALINGGTHPVVAAAAGVGTLTVSAEDAGTPFSTSVSSTGSAITLTLTTASRSVATELSAIQEADGDWFHFALDTRLAADIVRAADWSESAKRMFWAQSSSPDITASGDLDVFSELKAKSLRWVAPLFYSSDSVYADAAWMGKFAANDFDGEAPTAAFQTLATIPVEQLGATAQVNLDAKNASYYTTLKGVGATANALTPSGYDVELVVTGAWVEARMSENIASLFLRVSNSGGRIRYNDQGFQQIAGTALSVLKTGERIGHFSPETSQLQVPSRDSVSASDVEAGILRFRFGTQYTGRVKRVTINGIVAADFTSLEA